MWINEFETVLRRHCRFAAPDAKLDPDTALTLLGVDSMEIISLIVDLESALGIYIPEDVLTPQAFATPSALWAMMESNFRLTSRKAATNSGNLESSG